MKTHFDGHTKGPWRWTNGEMAEGSLQTAKGASIAYAIFEISNYGNKIDVEIDVIEKADAVLIAAAPDMLEELKACRDMLAMAELHLTHCTPDNPREGDIVSARLSAIDAILGVEG